MKTLIILSVVYLLFMGKGWSKGKCEHNKIMNDLYPNRAKHLKRAYASGPVNINMTINEERRRRSEGLAPNFRPIRIHLEYSYLDMDLFSEEDKTFWMNTMFPSLKSYFENLLSVFPADRNITIEKDSKLCPLDNSSSLMCTEKISTSSDLVLILTNENNANETYLAWATHCSQDESYFNRPITGLINFNLGHMKCTRSGWRECFETMAHELIHVFGLNSDLYDSFYDEFGSPLSSSNVYTKVEKAFSSITLKKVVDWAKIHFGCPSLTAVPLEDEGDAGSAGSHWDASILREEMMNPMARTQTQASNLTLNFLEATGWYVVNFDMAQTLVFGRDAGCDFLSKKCATIPKPKEYNCITTESECQIDFSSYGTCLSSFYTNECNMVEGELDYNCWMGEKMAYSQISVNETYSLYGPNSSCLKSSIKPKASSSEANGAGCYLTECFRNPQGAWVLNVTIGGETLQCLSKDQILTPSSKEFSAKYSGTILCPDLNFFCRIFSDRCYRDCNSNRGYCGQKNTCYFLDGQNGCDLGCSSCKKDSNNNQVCFKAKPGYFLDSQGNIQKCPDACLQCQEPKEGSCTLCVSGNFLSKGSCLKTSQVNGTVIETSMTSFASAQSVVAFIRSSNNSGFNKNETRSSILNGLKAVLISTNSIELRTNISFTLAVLSEFAVPSNDSFFSDLASMNRILQEFSSKIEAKSLNKSDPQPLMDTMISFEQFYVNQTSYKFPAAQANALNDLKISRDVFISQAISSSETGQFQFSRESLVLAGKALSLGEKEENLTLSSAAIKRSLVNEENRLILNASTQQLIKTLEPSANLVMILTGQDPLYYYDDSRTSKNSSAENYVQIFISSGATGTKLNTTKLSNASIGIWISALGRNTTGLRCATWNEPIKNWTNDELTVSTREKTADAVFCLSSKLSGFVKLELGPQKQAQLLQAKEEILNFGLYVSFAIMLIALLFGVPLFLRVLRKKKDENYSEVSDGVARRKNIISVYSILKTKNPVVAFQKFLLFLILLTFNLMINSLFYRLFLNDKGDNNDDAKKFFVPIALIGLGIRLFFSFPFELTAYFTRTRDPNGNIESVKAFFWPLCFLLISGMLVVSSWAMSFNKSTINGGLLVVSWLLTELFCILWEFILFFMVKNRKVVPKFQKSVLEAKGFY